MSKMDALRAMREARYAEMTARTAAPATARKKAAVRPPVAPPVEKAAKVDSAPAADTEALCGHRNMSGRTCTREHGHAAKSHRYS